MIQLNQKIEKRLLMRYPAIDGIVVAVRPHKEILGYMIDISLGGLSFRYIEAALDKPSSSELTILMSSPRFCLDRIPFHTVADFEIPAEFSFSSIRIRRRCVAFGPLNGKQRRAIEGLILTCSLFNSRLNENRSPAQKSCIWSPSA